MSHTLKLEGLPPRRTYYAAGGLPYGKEVASMQLVADGLAKGERIGLGTDNIERWLKRYELLHGTRPEVEPLGDVKDLYLLTAQP